MVFSPDSQEYTSGEPELTFLKLLEWGMRYISVLSALLIAGASLPLHAQQVTLGGQIRPRFEYREPAGDGDGRPKQSGSWLD